MCVPFMYGTIGVHEPGKRALCRTSYSKILNMQGGQQSADGMTQM
ncbi:hypothetical protein CBM2587_B90565 [Cupriavidus taiwanensis]|uniref:Uncharacterized protein n=1 Tax=Cupriavidus taiwanensis TaxID=164546 RepID=A0A975XET6_9BURK|nr:hypothetical protein CBM2587_B90565 [Cupriavidus taiwanensis]